MKTKILSLTKKDFKFSYFSGSGAGGQHRNRHNNCVRIEHPESGVMVTGQNQKSKTPNERQAFLRMTKDPRFKLWLDRKIAEEMSDLEEIEARVDRQMAESNLVVEYFDPK